jgi:hypothetical protein
MAKCDPELLQRAVNSARHLVDSACVLIAPKDYGTLPPDGFGFCCLETTVHQVPWMGFAATRAKLYELAGAEEYVDWVLMLDADDTFDPRSVLPDLDRLTKLGADAIAMPIDYRGIGFRWRWLRSWQLLRARRGFTFEGHGRNGLHEKLGAPYPSLTMRTDSMVYVVRDESPPRDEAKREAWFEANATRAGGRDYEEDWKSLWTDCPDDPHVTFLRAMAAKDAAATMPWHDDAKQRWRQMAYETFALRLTKNGELEETFWAHLMMGYLAPTLELSPDPIVSFDSAARIFPTRAEPYHGVASHYLATGQPEIAQAFFSRAAEQPYPTNAMGFVAVHCYSERALHEAGIE